MKTLLGGLFFVALLAPRIALGDVSDADRKRARASMEEGDALIATKDYERALTKYMAGDAIMNVPTTGLEVARTLQRLGRMVEAKEKAEKVSALPRAPDEPSVYERARNSARELAQSLRARVVTVELVVTGAKPDAKIAISVDGRSIADASLPLRKAFDPGQHEFSVSAPGHTTVVKSVSLTEGSSQKIEIELRAIAGAVRAQPADAVPPAPRPRSHISPLVYVGFGVGAAGLAVGSVTGLISLNKTSTAKQDCDGNSCPPSTRDDLDSARTFATISNVGFAFAVVGAAVGIYGLVSSNKHDGDANRGSKHAVSQSLRLEPALGPRFVGVFANF
jgi:hypothetical protein